MTTEQKLATIVETQVKGGCDKYVWTIGAALRPDGELIREHGRHNNAHHTGHVLLVLLDQEGLRAAYGETIIARREGDKAQTGERTVGEAGRPSGHAHERNRPPSHPRRLAFRRK